MMLSVSTVALAAMMGGSCPGNMANLNNCNPDQSGSCGVQYVQLQKGGADLSQLLKSLGVSCQAGSCRR